MVKGLQGEIKRMKEEKEEDRHRIKELEEDIRARNREGEDSRHRE